MTAIEITSFVQGALPLGVSFLLGLIGAILFMWAFLKPPVSKKKLLAINSLSAVGFLGFMPLFATVISG
jgi:hypothetical protein